MAYVLGYFAADGAMVCNARGGQYIEFTSTDCDLLQQVRRAMRSTHTVSIRPHRNSKWKTQYRLQIGSKEWFTALQGLGFTPAKSKSLRFPKVPNERSGDFVRGYFDGDGCVYLAQLKYADRTSKRWILQTLFTSGSHQFLRALHSLLRKHGVKGGSLIPKSNRRGFELKLSHRDSLALYILMYHTSPTSDLCLLRKKEKLERAVKLLKLDKTMRA